jgi:hypothetical protein
VIARTRLARAAASLILASALVVGTAGCTFITSQATLNQYDPADGVRANIGDLSLRNVVAIANESGDAASLLIHVINAGDGPHSLTIQYESDGTSTTITQVVRPGTNSFGNTVDEEQIVLTNAGVPAGGLVPVYFQYGTLPGTQLLVPVLEATGFYADLAPAPAG